MVKNAKQSGWSVLFLACLAVICTQAGVTMYTPSMPFMERALSVDYEQIAYTLTAYVLGYALAMLGVGGISDQLGRKRTYLMMAGLFALSSLSLFFTSSIYGFIFWRLLQGIGGGGFAVVARASVRDVYEGKKLVGAMSYISIAFHASMGGFQFLGGLFQTHADYKFDFLFMFVLGALLFMLVGLWFSETHHQAGKKFSVKNLARTYWQVLQEKSILTYAVGGGIGYAITLMFNVLGVYYLQKELEVSPQKIGEIGIFFSLSYLFGSLVLTRLLKFYEIETLVKSGKSLLGLAAILSLLSAVVSKDSVVLIVLPLAVGVIGQAILYPCAMTKALESQRANPGASSSLFGFTQQLCGFFIVSLSGWLPYRSLYSLSFMMALIALTSFLMLSFVRNAAKRRVGCEAAV